MAELKEQHIPQYGLNEVKAPNVILLWSSLAIKDNGSNSKSIENLLLSRNLRLEQLDGGNSENKELRNQLFNISRKRGKYPQIFIKDENKQIKFIGMDTDINFLIESDNFDKVFEFCMDDDSTADGPEIVDKAAEAMRYKKLAEQWFGAKNLFKAQKFARKSLRLHETEEVKQLLDKIKEAQFIEHEHEHPNDPNPDIMIIDDDEKEDVIYPIHPNPAPPVQPPPEIPPKNNDELVNQIIEQSMVLQQKNNKLETENQLLRQQLKNEKDMNYEKKKNGVVYECNMVKEYNSKKRNDIKIRSGVESSQNQSNETMNGHECRLNEWSKHTLHLNDKFNEQNKRYFVNDENNEDQKINVSEDDIKDHEALNVSELYLSYKGCTKLLQEQQQRTEDVMAHCMKLNEATESLKSIIKIYNNDVPETKRKYDTLCKNYDTLKQKRQDLQEQVKKLVIEINETIDGENQTNNEKCLTLDKFNLLRMELDRYENILGTSKSLTNRYSGFEDNVESKTGELSRYFKAKWDEHEKNWYQWKIDGIICWFKYLMHDNKLRLSKKFNLKTVEQKMIEEKVTGASLNDLERNDLRVYGFTIFGDQTQSYKKIRALVEKYPGPIDKQELFPPNAVTPDGGEGQKIKIPPEYICPISKKIMANPVMAYDNKMYDKDYIVQYIKEHKRAPGAEHECDGDPTFTRNRQLKTKIEQFLWANPSINADE